jgi:hypothetical protein
MVYDSSSHDGIFEILAKDAIDSIILKHGELIITNIPGDHKPIHDAIRIYMLQQDIQAVVLDENSEKLFFKTVYYGIMKYFQALPDGSV